MAKVHRFSGETDQPVVMEDPRSGNDGWWIFGVRHDKTSLTPQFDKKMNWAVGAGWTNWHGSNNTGANTETSQAQLLLRKMTTHQNEWNTTSATSYNVPNDSAWRWMDETEESEVSFSTWTEHDDGNGNKRLAMWNAPHTQTVYLDGYTQNLSDSQYLDEVRLSPDADPTFNALKNPMAHPSWTSGGFIYAMAQFDGSSTYFYPNYKWLAAGTGWPNSYGSGNMYDPSGFGSNWSVQVLGTSQVDGQPLLCGTYASAGTLGNSVKIVKATLGSSYNPTWTQMAHLENVETTSAGTHQGGYNLNNDAFWHTYSKTFTDPRDAGKKAFYKGYWDSYGDFHPMVVTWNLADDTFAIETDISITGDKSSAHVALISSTFDSSNFRCDLLHTETWVSNNQRYVAYFPMDGRINTASESDPAKKTAIVYSVDAANPKALTYHSKLDYGQVARNMIWLNDSRTMMGVWFKSNFKIYVWNDSTGWGETATVDSIVTACGRDSLDRIWYCQEDGEVGSNYPELHLLTPTLPVTVSITPENTSYSYAGSNISTYVNVSAINASGARIATSVKLVIEGSSMTFSDSTTTKTVTTLTTGELQVDTIITGAGFTNVTASIEI